MNAQTTIVAEPSSASGTVSGELAQRFTCAIHTANAWPACVNNHDAVASTGVITRSAKCDFEIGRTSSGESETECKFRTAQQYFSLETELQACETSSRTESHSESYPAPVTQPKAISLFLKRSTPSDSVITELNERLNSFKSRHMFLGKFEMLGRLERRHGGMNIVSNFITAMLLRSRCYVPCVLCRCQKSRRFACHFHVSALC